MSDFLPLCLFESKKPLPPCAGMDHGCTLHAQFPPTSWFAHGGNCCLRERKPLKLLEQPQKHFTKLSLGADPGSGEEGRGKVSLLPLL